MFSEKVCRPTNNLNERPYGGHKRHKLGRGMAPVAQLIFYYLTAVNLNHFIVSLSLIKACLFHFTSNLKDTVIKLA